MNKICLLTFTLFMAGYAYGQFETGHKSDYSEKGFVYLKNGSVLKGKYIYSDSMEKLRVVSGRNSWVFDVAEVEKVSKSRPEKIFEDDPDFSAVALPASKWFNLTEIGVLTGNNDNSQEAPMVFGSSFNYQVYKNLSAGAGLGVEFLKETYMPLTVNLLYKFRNTRFTPYALLQGGYQFPVEDSRTIYYKVVPDYVTTDRIWPGPWPNSQSEMKAKGGFLMNPSLGLMKQTSSGFGLSLAFGYRFHRLHYTAEEDYRLDIDFNRLSVKLGIIIN